MQWNSSTLQHIENAIFNVIELISKSSNATLQTIENAIVNVAQRQCRKAAHYVFMNDNRSVMDLLELIWEHSAVLPNRRENQRKKKKKRPPKHKTTKEPKCQIVHFPPPLLPAKWEKYSKITKGQRRRRRRRRR